MQNLLTPEVVQTIAGLLLLVITTVVLPRVYAWLKVDRDSKLRLAVESAIQHGIKFGVNKIVNKDDKTTLKQALYAVVSDPAVKDNVVAEAKEYVSAQVPATLKKLGVDDEATYRAVEARLQDSIDSLAKSAQRQEALLGRS